MFRLKSIYPLINDTFGFTQMIFVTDKSPTVCLMAHCVINQLLSHLLAYQYHWVLLSD